MPSNYAAATPTWRAWYALRLRGIPICEGWDDFETFREDMGEAPVDRPHVEVIDRALGLVPGNCRWTSQGNNRSDNQMVTIHNKTQTIAQWAEEYGIPYHTLYQRVLRGKRKGADLLTSGRHVR